MVDTELLFGLVLDITEFLTFHGCILNPSQEALLHLVSSVEMAMSEQGSDRAYLASRLFTLACNSTELNDPLRRRVFCLSFELDKAR
jgi:hypothetical protein